MYPTPRDRKYRAKGGGFDDGPALQAFFDANAGKSVWLDQPYHSGRSPVIHAGTKVYSYHPNAGLYAHPSLPANAEFVRLGSGVELHNVGIYGTPEHREGGATAVIIQNADDVLLNGVHASWFHHLITLAATNRLKIHHCNLGHYSDSKFLPLPGSEEGKAIIAANEALPPEERIPANQLRVRGNCQDNGGYAILGGNSAWPNKDVEIIGGRIHDGYWTAIDCLGPLNINWQIIGVEITNVHECGIYQAVAALIDRCTIVGVKKRDCSAHCIEGGAIGAQITRNTFGRADTACMWFTNPIDVRFSGNTCYDGMEEAAPGAPPSQWSAALFARTLADPDHPSSGLTIEDNDFYCNNGKMAHMLSMFDFGGGPFKNVVARNNRLHGKWLSDAPISVDPKALAADSKLSADRKSIGA